ncbi:MAG: hypothetical protein AAF652_10710, partial [Cyanobacteria bacterium P01_C01_bin.72]
GFKFSLEVLGIIGGNQLIPKIKEAQNRVEELDLEDKQKRQLEEDIQLTINSLQQRVSLD